MPLAELADEQVVDAVAVEVADERGGVADVGVDRLAGGLDPHRRCQFARRAIGLCRGEPQTVPTSESLPSSASFRIGFRRM